MKIYKSYYIVFLPILIVILCSLLLINHNFKVRSFLAIMLCVSIYAFVKRRVYYIELNLIEGTAKLKIAHYFLVKTDIKNYKINQINLTYSKTKGARNTSLRIFKINIQNKKTHEIEIPIDGWSESTLFIIQKEINNFNNVE